MYGFGNIKMCAARALGKAKVDISLDGVKVKEVEMLIVRDDALPHNLLIGRSLLDRENISLARIGNKFHVCYAEYNPFANMECERNSVNFVRAQTTLANDGSVNIEGKEGCCDSLLEIKGGETIIPINNMGDGNVLLKENQCVGTVIELDPNCLVHEESYYADVIKENKRLIETSEIRFNEETPIEDKREILELVNEVRDCFEMKLSELRCTTLTKIDRIVARLTNAPTEFQRLMPHVLGPLLNTKALIEKKFDLEVYETTSVDEQVLIQRGDPELDNIISNFRKRKFERHKDWDLRMKELDRNLNNALSKATNKNPFQMLHSYSSRFNH
ncbi:retrovirus-related Pol polyprotein from transposon 412 [Caerostris darwini]|uniref:Retrovirus-related Pol polyprotein from transposon 412 n=1 Tax=Caerostris darwini TaxID=1538125 RepID=A0AAV4USY4_9ARAC|nr:retrovirus-related Pol polyprotein from transposon 412 [Caerostris darwini]